MNEQELLDELVSILQSNGVEIRRESLDGRGGGLCTLKGQKVFFVDTEAPSNETAVLCAEAILNNFDIEDVYLRPQVRQFIQEQIGHIQ